MTSGPHRASDPPSLGSALWVLLALFALGCRPTASSGTLILISFDGFRWDYLDRPAAASLAQRARQGVRAAGLVPVFPSKTFPNHYSIVTGLVADEHGLVANNMWDPRVGKSYGLSNREAVADGSWYGGTPIWVLAERAGITTAPLFWPGSEAAIDGVRPSYWKPYDHDMTPDSLVSYALGLLSRPDSVRPRFVALYFHQADGAGHDWGPDSPELDSVLAVLGAAVDSLMTGLANLGLERSTDVMLVSDHGMAATEDSQVIYLDDHLDMDGIRVSDWNPVLAMWPDSAELEAVVAALDQIEHLSVYRREELPERLRYGKHPRVAPVIGLADLGWSVTTRGYAERNPGAFDGGNHGYDPAAREMHGIFVAWGPSFRSGITLPPIENVHLFPVMAAILGLDPPPGTGSLTEAEPALEPRILAGATVPETAAGR